MIDSDPQQDVRNQPASHHVIINRGGRYVSVELKHEQGNARYSMRIEGNDLLAVQSAANSYSGVEAEAASRSIGITGDVRGFAESRSASDDLLSAAMKRVFNMISSVEKIRPGPVVRFSRKGAHL